MRLSTYSTKGCANRENLITSRKTNTRLSHPIVIKHLLLHTKQNPAYLLRKCMYA